MAPKVLPSRPTKNVFRNRDLFDPIQLFETKNVVQIFGITGIGKSCLIKKLIHFIADRDMMRGGIIYMDFA